MFAPMMTPIACLSVIRPASTKLTVMTVTALLLCTRTVTPVPTSTPSSGVRVRTPTSLRRRSPARSWSESLRSLIAKRKIPMPPKSWIAL